MLPSGVEWMVAVEQQSQENWQVRMQLGSQKVLVLGNDFFEKENTY
jgi:hypothetical protein